MILAENELGSQNLSEFSELLEIYADLRPLRFIEIGSMYGWSLQHFIHYAEEGCTALVIDLPVDEADWRSFKQKVYREYAWPEWARANHCDLHVILGRSQDASTWLEANEILSGGQVDFLFIDGDHSYDGVRSDFEMYGSLVRDGGVVALHDVGVNSFTGTHRLWMEIRDTGTSYVEILRDPKGKAGIGVLFK